MWKFTLPSPWQSLLRLSFALLITLPLLWIVTVLGLGLHWQAALIIGLALTLLQNVRWRALSLGLALAVLVIPQPGALLVYPVTAGAVVLALVLLCGLSFALDRPDGLANVAAGAFGLVLALVLANAMAGLLLRGPQAAQTDLPPLPEATPTPAAPPEPDPTAEPSPQAPAPAAAEAPAPEQPLPGWGYQEFLIDGGEASWTNLTGYGPRVNSTVRSYMVGADGETVYDAVSVYNSYGMRGPQIGYAKPEDTYRILIIGDSFVESIQVPYEQSFPALLDAQLDDLEGPSRRYEVLAMGRTGWGTLQQVIYYQNEGYKFEADLVVSVFFINDVADNFPRFFYPNINNTNYEYLIEGGSVRLVDTNQQPLPPNASRQLFNALPLFMQNSGLARLMVRLGDPPTPVVTPGTVLERVHPQYYIYVTQPEVEGYAEAWRRTDQAYDILADSVQQNGAELVVVPIFLGAEQVRSVSGWWPELVEGWQWDDSLPEQRLTEVLADTPAQLVPTRPVFEAYAQQQGGEVYSLVYLPEDGHFNPLGHQLTAETIYAYLAERAAE